MNIEHLRKEVERVFPFVEKPEGLALSYHQDDCFKCGYLRNDLSQYQDKELPPEGIRKIYQDISCLSAQGWRWVLPSYLRYCLSKDVSYHQMEVEFFIYNLSPQQEQQFETQLRLSALNQDQICCLICFLQWCQGHEHWGQHCSEEIALGIRFLSALAA